MVCDCFFVCACLDRGLPLRRHAPVPKHSERLPARAEWINKVIRKKRVKFSWHRFPTRWIVMQRLLATPFSFRPSQSGPFKVYSQLMMNNTSVMHDHLLFEQPNPSRKKKKKDFSFFRFLAKLHQKLSKNSQGVLRQVVLQRFFKSSLFLTLDLKGKQ